VLTSEPHWIAFAVRRAWPDYFLGLVGLTPPRTWGLGSNQFDTMGAGLYDRRQ